jgi:type II secretory pathway pseudopilin PulG
LTLIELLMVVVIMVMVVSVAIPLVNYNFGEKKLRESARALNAYFALAKSLAAERNRQVGVMFERTAGSLNQCLTMYLVEVPQPYSGDLYDARCFVRKNPNLTGYATQYEVVFDAKCATLLASRALVALGDTFLIRFNYKGQVFAVQRHQIGSGGPNSDVFVLQTVPNPPIPGFWLPYDYNMMTDTYDFNTRGWGASGIDDDGFNGIDDAYEQGIAVYPTNTRSYGASDFPVGLPFQIYLSPKRTQAQPIELPVGVAIDLAWSGMGAGGAEFDAWSTGVNQLPLTGPVIVLFTPGGQIERIYPGNGGFFAPTSTVHFLVASPETIQPLQAGVPNTTPNPKSSDLNLQSPSHLWISVGPVNASVTTAEVFYDPTAYSLDVCRQFARTAQSKGGG